MEKVSCGGLPPGGEMGGVGSNPSKLERGFDRNPLSWVPPSRVQKHRTPAAKPGSAAARIWRRRENRKEPQLGRSTRTSISSLIEPPPITSFVVSSTIPRNMVVPFDTRHRNTSRCSCCAREEAQATDSDPPFSGIKLTTVRCKNK